MVEHLHVNLGERSYRIEFGADLTSFVHAQIEPLRAAGRRCAVVTDANVARTQASVLDAMFGDLPRLVLPSGEETKSLAEFGRVLDFLAAQRIDRSGVLFAVGGGVIGDLAGYAAASYLRGIAFFQVPTTLLAMVDSSVGGKTGINISAGKNLVGAFHQPNAVAISTGLLATLPLREFAAGMAEVIKYGMLGDIALFRQLEENPLRLDSAELPAVIRTCCAIKARIVEADERELAKEGGRALLNLGHTFGHAIEKVAGYGTYLHGEAVAIGLVACARLSAKLGQIAAEEIARVERILAAHNLPTKLRAPLPLEKLMSAVSNDKKVRAGLPRFVIMNALGDAATRSGIDAALVETCFREVGASG